MTRDILRLLFCILLVAAGWFVQGTLGGSLWLFAQVQVPPTVSEPLLESTFAEDHARARLDGDFEALRVFRPAHEFWQHVFTIPDGNIIFGSAEDGRLLVTFPTRGNWVRDGVWENPEYATVVAAQRLPRRLTQRREALEELLAPVVGAVIHNPTRGRFVSPHAQRFGGFLSEWGTIYERFAVPAEIGLSQAVVESGLNGRARSGARALGLCQWLPRNWNYLKRLSPYVIEGYNQTTQAPYCAAYLSILATMYGSFIPALSEHHAGGVNVGRVLINGKRLGGSDTREEYFIGSDFAQDLRAISIRRFRALFRTYGPRSALYAEMVFGNTFNVRKMMEEIPQTKVFAMRVSRNVTLSEVAERTGLSRDEVKRFNPALVRQVPAGANLYLPLHLPEFGSDVAFWHRPASLEYEAVLDDFVRLDASVDRWHESSFQQTLREFRTRFESTGTEEGTIMAIVLTYVMQDLSTSRRAAILEEFRNSDRVRELFERGVRELTTSAGS